MSHPVLVQDIQAFKFLNPTDLTCFSQPPCSISQHPLVSSLPPRPFIPLLIPTRHAYPSTCSPQHHQTPTVPPKLSPTPFPLEHAHCGLPFSSSSALQIQIDGAPNYRTTGRPATGQLLMKLEYTPRVRVPITLSSYTHPPHRSVHVRMCLPGTRTVCPVSPYMSPAHR